MVSILVVLYSSYFIGVFLLLWGWRKTFARRADVNLSPSAFLLSVLIPVRNEERHLGTLLDALDSQKDDATEIIVINDHSEDLTARIVEERIARGYKNLSLVPLVNGQGKKEALSLGVAASKGSVIVTTDADCTVPRGWLSSVRQTFRDSHVQFLFGGVRIDQSHSLWSAIEGMEFASLVGSGAAFFGLGTPFLCNGANLAFRKESFYRVGGYTGNEHIASGDDAFLLRKFSASYSNGVRFCTNPDHVVVAKGTTSLREFVDQRLRWAGKWHRQGISGGLTAVLVFLFHASFIVVNGWAILTGLWQTVLVLWCLKALLEYLFLKKVVSFTGQRWNGSAFFVLQMFYSFYVVIFGVLAQASVPVWKGRKIKSLTLSTRD